MRSFLSVFRKCKKKVAIILFPALPRTQLDMAGETLHVLKKNASYVLEPRFRDSLVQTLLLWQNSEISYEEAKRKIDCTLEQRGKGLGLGISFHAICQLLQSNGFFSSSIRICGNHRLRQRSLISSLTPAVASIRQGTLRDFLVLRSEQEKTISLLNDPVSQSGMRVLSGNRSSLNLPGSKVLIVGPSVLYEELSLTEFDEIVFLATPKSNPGLLQGLCDVGTCSVVMNGELGRMVLQADPDSIWIKQLKRSQKIYCSEPERDALARVLRKQVDSKNSQLVKLFPPSSAPNLAQFTMGIVLRDQGKGVTVTLHGVDLYANDKIYANGQGTLTSSQNEVNLAKFSTCRTMARHDALMNFSVMKRLRSTGVIVGSKQLVEILGLEPHSYLARLDLTLGRSRL